MWASQVATVPRTDAEFCPIALGSLCGFATRCRGSRWVKRSDVNDGKVVQGANHWGPAGPDSLATRTVQSSLESLSRWPGY